MASPLPAETLLEAVKQLPPDALARFTASFTEWHESSEGSTDEVLVQRTKLSRADQWRQEKLADKSQRRELTADDLQEYQTLSQRAERINAIRIGALAELAQRRNRPIPQLMTEFGWRDLETIHVD